MTIAIRSHHLHLTPRDIQILLMVYRYDGMVNSQLKRRFWPNYGSRSPYYQRLSRLISAGFIRSVRLPSLAGSGSGPSWLTLGSRAHSILAAHAGLSKAGLRHLRHSYVPMFWRHEAMLRDFRLTLELACDRSSTARLVEWLNESEPRRNPLSAQLDLPWVGSTTGLIDVVPDAVFTLERSPGEKKRFFLEIDRGTQVTPQRFKRKIKQYHIEFGLMQSAVLFVAPDEGRELQLARWIREESPTHSEMFATTRGDQITTESIVHEPIWRVVGGPRISLVPRGASPLPVAEGDP